MIELYDIYLLDVYHVYENGIVYIFAASSKQILCDLFYQWVSVYL